MFSLRQRLVDHLLFAVTNSNNNVAICYINMYLYVDYKVAHDN